MGQGRGRGGEKRGEERVGARIRAHSTEVLYSTVLSLYYCPGPSYRPARGTCPFRRRGSCCDGELLSAVLGPKVPAISCRSNSTRRCVITAAHDWLSRTPVGSGDPDETGIREPVPIDCPVERRRGNTTSASCCRLESSMVMPCHVEAAITVTSLPPKCGLL
jgi:hypothetical protein